MVFVVHSNWPCLLFHSFITLHFRQGVNCLLLACLMWLFLSPVATNTLVLQNDRTISLAVLITCMSNCATTDVLCSLNCNYKPVGKKKGREELIWLNIGLPHFQPLFVVEWPPPTVLLTPLDPLHPWPLGLVGCLRVRRGSTLGVWWSAEGCVRCTDPFTLLLMHSGIDWLIACNTQCCTNKERQL